MLQLKSRILTGPVVVAALGLTLSACADNLHHRETVTTHAGDTQAANIALQTIDPWSPHASNTKIISDGEQGVKAIENYRNGGEGDQSTTAGAITLVPAGGRSE